MKKLLVRSLSGLVYVGIIVACIFWGRDGLCLLSCLLGVVAVLEFQRITGAITRQTMPAVALDVVGTLCLCLSWYRYPLVIWLMVLLLRGTLELYLKSQQPHIHIAQSVFSQIYIGLPLGLMLWIYSLTGNPMTVLLLFIFIWINDTGAFLVGSICGRRRLFERISPKKSWEGFFGGLCLVMIVAAVFCAFCPATFGLPQVWGLWLVSGACVTVFATWGDLFESLLKRTLGIKDSGHWIPGHGGILDRIDSLLFALPTLFVILWFYFL